MSQKIATPAAKPRRWKRRTCAERSCRHIQKESDFVHIVKAAPFDRLVRSMVSEFSHDARMTKDFKVMLGYPHRLTSDGMHPKVLTAVG